MLIWKVTSPKKTYENLKGLGEYFCPGYPNKKLRLRRFVTPRADGQIIASKETVELFKTEDGRTLPVLTPCLFSIS